MLALAVPLVAFYFLVHPDREALGPLSVPGQGRPAPGSVAGFVAGLPFPPDPFQREAFDALDGRALGAGVGARPARARPWSPPTPCTGPSPRATKAFYTTPLKALSQPEVRRAGRPPRASEVGLLDRRHRDPPPGAGGGDDHRGAAQHAAGRLVAARGPQHGGARRGPLPPGPLPGRGLGGGAGPLPARGRLRLPVGHRRQRQRARGLAALGARADRHRGRAAPAHHLAPPLRRAPAPRTRRPS